MADTKAQIGYRRRAGKYGGKPSVVVNNTLARQFNVDAPDRFWVTGVLDVLLDNAIEYGRDRGNIAIHAENDGRNYIVHILVCDDGRGVPPERMDQLFAGIETSDQGVGRQGMGLFLAHRRVRRLGCKLSYHSSRSGGACFVLTMPKAGQS